MSSVLHNLPPDFNFKQVDILEKTLSANIALAELNGLILSIPHYEVLLLPLTAREAVASSEIENIFTTTLDLLEAELFPENNLSPAKKETLHYKHALLHGYNSVLKKEFISTNQVVDIQAILAPSKGGIRSIPGTKLMNNLGEVVYTPPQDKKEILSLMKNWEAYCNAKDSKEDALIRMAILHHQFESIHPFYDGNGRTGRILMVLHLMLEGRLRFPVLFLSGYLLKTKTDYYRLLQEVRTHNKWKEWILYILHAVEVQALETSGKIIKIKELQTKLKENFKNKLPKIYSAELADYLLSKAFYTQGDLVQTFSINRKTAARYLRLLVENKILKMKKVKKSNLYYLPEFIKILG